MWVIKLEHHSPLGTCTLVDFPCGGLGCQERILFSITRLGAELLHCNALSVSLWGRSGGRGGGGGRGRGGVEGESNVELLNFNLGTCE